MLLKAMKRIILRGFSIIRLYSGVGGETQLIFLIFFQKASNVESPVVTSFCLGASRALKFLWFSRCFPSVGKVNRSLVMNGLEM